MPRFREEKTRLRELCLSSGWKAVLDTELAAASRARAAINPLLALLPRPECRWQAAYGLGLAVALIARENMEPARVFMRRLMWSLNEESGNLGWGVPEAMGCILAESPALAAEYARILISYGYETGKDDNFLDHPPLRAGVYWGVGRLAQKNPVAALPALPHLAAALGGEDNTVKGAATWAVARLAEAAPAPEFSPPGHDRWLAAYKALEDARRTAPDAVLTLFDGDAVREFTLPELMAEAMQAIAAHTP